MCPKPGNRGERILWGATLLVTLTAGALAAPAASFEFATHAAMTREAYLASALAMGGTSTCGAYSRLVCSLGIDRQFDALGAHYIDISDTSAMVRASRPESGAHPVPEFGAGKVKSANSRSLYKPLLPSAPAWLMLGAIREDDVPYDEGEIENTPQDEPDGPFIRVLNHFYDPYNNRPLAVLDVPLKYTAPDWAIDAPDRQTFANGTSVQTRGNHFSLVRAREAMWRAVTLKVPPAQAVGGSLADLAFTPDSDVPTGEALRNAYWATVFRALGDVVHLVQDMAQPQHTRNDPHAGLGCLLDKCALGHKSYFEGYVEARAVGTTRFSLRERLFKSSDPQDTLQLVDASPLSFGGYPLPRFGSYRSYFATNTGGSSVTGLGLANYSNQGFYSFGTVVGTSEAAQFPSPPSTLGSLVRTLIPEGSVKNAADSRIAKGSLALLHGAVNDSLNQGLSEASVPLASVGAFDQFMNPTLFWQATLNHYNYSHQARLLIPRAVAYSAGLIDYFFRGRMEISPPAEGVYAIVDQKTQACKDTCGFDRIKLKLMNATPGEALGPGAFVAVAKYRRNKCYTADLAGEPGGSAFTGFAGCRNGEEEIVVSNIVGNVSLPSSAEAELAFVFPKRIPVNASDLFLQVVFRGRLGSEEDAVAVETKDIGEPAFIGFANNTDYVYSFGDGKYHALPWGGYAAADEILAMKLRFGGATAPVAAHLDRLTAGQHAQIAYLADKGATTVVHEFASLRYAAFSPLTFSLPTAEFESRASTSYYDSTLPVTKTRGVHRQTYVSNYLPPDATIHPCPGAGGDFCAQTTLTPLQPTNAVAWAIDFN